VSSGRMEIKNSTGHIVTLDDAAMTISIGDEQGDTIVFDAKNRTLTLDVRQGVAITVAGGTVSITAPAGITIRSDALRLEGASIAAAGTSLSLEGTNVVLGDSAAVRLVREELIDLYNSHRHLDGSNVLTGQPTQQASKATCCTSRTKGS